jgi:hypothetical protein
MSRAGSHSAAGTKCVGKAAFGYRLVKVRAGENTVATRLQCKPRSVLSPDEKAAVLSEALSRQRERIAELEAELAKLKSK